jgi:hypothetical protein
MIALTVAQDVQEVVTIWRPASMPAARSYRCRAAVPELTATAAGLSTPPC